MTINAYLVDFFYCTIGENYVIENDDDFADLVDAARTLAAAGTPCAIRWSRSNDGQVAYWGPAGSVFDPHWYGQGH